MEHLYPDKNDVYPGLELEAFKEVYHVFFRQVYSFVSRFSLRSEDTEEIVQDVFMKLWEKRISIDPEKNLSSLLFTIAQHLVIDKIRKYAAEKRQIDFLKEGVVAATTSENTAQLLNFYELLGIVSKLVDGLPDKRRSIFKLSREKGFTYKEIADFSGNGRKANDNGLKDAQTRPQIAVWYFD
ncbi:MAG: sigma-70 family RNA polymerase sigma factor [Cyclobacteriaceae bacterium]|nr:sigma-70 family RNA polymerase sigma factor [Cyclobacteriaceae bacterium]